MLIQSMNFTMDVSGQFSVLLILSLVGLALNRTIQLVRRRVLFWDPSEKERAARLIDEAAQPAEPREEAAVKKEVTAW
ncbi:MAG TPA: hypothetical protein VGX21_01000, partial [Methylomirabilota bacterium]|nr:hypothetical protein [Methylomirabilota bacterium]